MKNFGTEKKESILIVTPLNELSGSCIVAKQALTILSNSFKIVNLCSPKGNFLKPDIESPVLGGNIFEQYFWYLKNRKRLKKFDVIICYTIRCLLVSLLLGRRSVLYLHEASLGGSLITSIATFVVRTCVKRVAIVNPELRDTYGESSLCIPNCFDDKDNDVQLVNDESNVDFLMVANFSPKKGIHILRELAVACPQYQFVLLTNIELADSRALSDFINTLPTNIRVETNQDLKAQLLYKARYVLNLSLLNETFGLTHFEAVSFNAIPLCFENMGSRYVLGGNYPFLDRESIVESFHNSLSIFDNDRHKTVKNLNDRFIKMFGEANVESAFHNVIEIN